jgi:hypothetical protein
VPTRGPYAQPSRTHFALLDDRLYFENAVHRQHDRPFRLHCDLGSYCVNFVSSLDWKSSASDCERCIVVPRPRKASLVGAKVCDRCPASFVASDLRERVRRTLKLKQQMAWILTLLRWLDWQEDSAGLWPAASGNSFHRDEGKGWSELVLGLPECTDLRAGH